MNMYHALYSFFDKRLREIVLKKKRIAICPMGEIGIMVKNILNNRYGVEETYVIDNGLAEINTSVLSLKELIEKDDLKDLIIILSAKSLKVRSELKAEMENLNIRCEYVDIFSPIVIESKEKYTYFKEIKALFETKKVVNRQLIRIGNENDGGYIMCDNFKGSKIAYSFGIGRNVSWDIHMATYGLKIYMYDPTINKLPEENENFRFFKIGIAAEDGLEKDMSSLETLLKINGHENIENIILKMDVEGAEWDAIDTIPKKIMKKFSQITLELHGICEEKNKEQKLNVLKKLNQTHQAIWVHGCNWNIAESANGILIPNVLEVTYVNRSECIFQEAACEYPLLLDSPTHKYLDDIYLGNWGKQEM